ncbi:MAG: FmdE family protein [Halobacteriales archaeon]|nr:FmdE family protein [Halobacteriales archaeon]
MDKVRVALHQLQPELGEPERNLRTLAKRVQASKADLCVFPELYLSGYFNRDALRTLAEPLDGPLCAELGRIAKRTGAHIVTGTPRQGLRGIAHNSSVLATPDGEVHAYDKVYLPTFSVFEEDIYFGEGHGFPVFKTSLGRIGMSICYDLFFPEVTKAMAMQGAEILTCISASPTISRTYFEQVLPARAIETTCFLLFTNLIGPQDQVTFWGGARAFGPRGDLLAQGPLMEDATTKCTLDLEEVPVARLRRPVLRDTRPELLGAVQGALDALPQVLFEVERFHGRLDPFAVAGLRAGQHARHALRGEDGRVPRLRAQVRCPLRAPEAAWLDGFQLGSGCTLGTGQLRVEDAGEIEARVEAAGRVAVVGLPIGAATRFAAAKGGRASREVALWAFAAPLHEVVSGKA